MKSGGEEVKSRIIDHFWVSAVVLGMCLVSVSFDLRSLRCVTHFCPVLRSCLSNTLNQPTKRSLFLCSHI